ncbi:MAG: SAM-dependent methyltransferase [Pirellulales bacterium]
MDSSEGISPPLFEITWDEDRQYRMDPAVVTSLLREQVPVLDFVQWTVTTIEPGYTESVLPLNPQSTNQHFTHQAALAVLAGDYTGGTALASLMPGWPVIGVHPVTSPQSVSMWLLKVDIKYLRPSVTDLKVSARIDDDTRQRVQKRFLAGQAVIETIAIEFRNGDTMIAEANLTYFARQSVKLRSEGISTERVNSLYELKLTSSAELIAGVRARESGRLYDDPYAAPMAGQHGMALATRFCERSPQLGGMVAARTWHLDRAIMNFVEAGGRDIAIVGVGWDMRAFRLQLPEGTRFYELDFPTTLLERGRRLAQLELTCPAGITCTPVPIDLRTMPLDQTLGAHLPADVPVLLAWEGMSMYFQEHEVRDILAGMLSVLQRPDSLLWVDLMDRQAVEHPEQYAETIRKFLRGMQILGEPFTFGTASIPEFMESVGLRSLEVVPSDICLRGRKDPVYEIYRFCVAAAASTSEFREPATFKITRSARPTRTPSRPHLPGNQRRELGNGQRRPHRNGSTKTPRL